MKMNRRNVLVGIGAIVAGGGAALGTGAFSQVEATREANVSVADDANAFLALEPVDGEDNPYVGVEDGQIVFYFDGEGEADVDGLNDNAVTRFEDILRVTNNGTNEVVLSITARDNGENSVNTGLELIGVENLSGEGDSTEIGFEFDLTEDGGDATDIESIVKLVIEANEV